MRAAYEAGIISACLLLWLAVDEIFPPLVGVVS